MCGRYASTRARQELLDDFQIRWDATEGVVEPDYNVAPTKPVPAVIERVPREREHAGEEDPHRPLWGPSSVRGARGGGCCSGRTVGLLAWSERCATSPRAASRGMP